jgi:short-subunit dehydrogenase involved in D-alanine esterification of teichoic acids
MLSEAIKRLTNLKVFQCVIDDNETLTPLLEILEKHHPNLESLLIG